MAEPCLSSFGHGIHIEILEGPQKPIALKELASTTAYWLALDFLVPHHMRATKSHQPCAALTLKLISVN
jgi:hypothetical protein